MNLTELKARAGDTVNYRYLAYALSQGCDTVDEVFERDGSNAGYMGFISRCCVDAKRALGWRDSHAPIPDDAMDAAVMRALNGARGEQL